jgi:hypothetical protein
LDKVPSKLTVWLIAAFFMVGIVASSVIIVKRVILIRSGEIARGKVLACYVAYSSHHNLLIHKIVGYTPPDGDAVTFDTSEGPRFRIGGHVKVLYNPSDPSDAVIYSQRWSGLPWIGVIGFSFMCWVWYMFAFYLPKWSARKFGTPDAKITGIK